MKPLTILSMCIALLFGVSAAAEPAWRHYVNDRFGAAADIPPDWNMGEAPTNGDGREFTSADGQAVATVSGGFAHWDSYLADAASAHDGETVTYRRKNKHSVVVSGIKETNRYISHPWAKEPHIFYRKTLLGCRNSIASTLFIEYPIALKSHMDPIVKRMAASLRQERGAECDSPFPSAKSLR